MDTSYKYFPEFPLILCSRFLLLEISEDEAEEKLQVAIQDKFSVFGEVCFDW